MDERTWLVSKKTKDSEEFELLEAPGHMPEGEVLKEYLNMLENELEQPSNISEDGVTLRELPVTRIGFNTVTVLEADPE